MFILLRFAFFLLRNNSFFTRFEIFVSNHRTMEGPRSSSVLAHFWYENKASMAFSETIAQHGKKIGFVSRCITVNNFHLKVDNCSFCGNDWICSSVSQMTYNFFPLFSVFPSILARLTRPPFPLSNETTESVIFTQSARNKMGEIRYLFRQKFKRKRNPTSVTYSEIAIIIPISYIHNSIFLPFC